MKDEKYPIEFEVMTPLSVGAGNDNEWVRGVDYVEQAPKIYVLDQNKMVEAGVDMERVSQLFLRQDHNGVVALLGNKLAEVSKYVFDLPAYCSNPIKSFLRTQLYDKPLVAGSSIKGAVRSALFKYLRDKETDNVSVFGEMKYGTDFMRFVRIGDVEMPSTVLVNSKIFNLWKDNHGNWNGGWKHSGHQTTAGYAPTGFNTLYECVPPGCKSNGNIILAGNAFELLLRNTDTFRISHKEKKTEILNTGIRALFSIVNDYTREYLKKERHFFTTYSTDGTDEIVDEIDHLLSLIPDDGSSCLIKMSAGAGFHAITGDYQCSDFTSTGIDYKTGKKKYKSRKTCTYEGRHHLMGFVRMRCLTEDETIQMRRQNEESHSRFLKEALEPILERKAAKEKEELERQRRREAIIAEQQKKEEYNQLVEKAKTLYMENRWDESLHVLQQAAELLPENKVHQELMNKVMLQKQAEEYRKQDEIERQQALNQPLKEVLRNKSSVGNAFNTLAKWKDVSGHSFGEEECQVLIDCLKNLPKKEQKKIGSRLKDLHDKISEEYINKIKAEFEI